MKKLTMLLTWTIFFCFPVSIFAHPGNVSSDGCHFCRTNCEKWSYTYETRHGHSGQVCDPSKGPVDPRYSSGRSSQPIKQPTKPPIIPTSTPSLTKVPTVRPTAMLTLRPTSTPKPTVIPTPESTPTEEITPTLTSEPTVTPMSEILGETTQGPKKSKFQLWKIFLPPFLWLFFY